MKIRVRHIPYIEDLGKIKTVDGYKVKEGLLFRSCNLTKTNSKDLLKLKNKYHINHVVDLRTSDEIATKPEITNHELNYHHVPIADNYEYPLVTKENQFEILEKLMALEGGTYKYVIDYYPRLAFSETSIIGYKAIFKLLLNNKENEGFLFHCTQGKDRTGMVMLFILTALGVDKETIIKKYLQYNHYNWPYKFGISLGLTFGYAPRYAKALSNILSAKREFIESAFNAIDQKCGSVENYLKEIIGLTNSDILALKDRYLDK